jgi:hypothetical protein
MGCYEKESESIHSHENFQSRYLLGMSTTDAEAVIDVIKYIDSIIEADGNKRIKSIYYNKAQLFYRLKKYDEAMTALYQSDDDSYDVFKAALLILLGCDTEARILLDNQIEKEKMILNKFSGKETQKDNIILGIISLYVLSNTPVDSFFSELINDNIITQEYIENVIINQIPQRYVLLNSIWPE